MMLACIFAVVLNAPPPEKPAALEHAAPNYPAWARSGGIEGAVVLRITVGTDGRVSDARILDGHPVFSEPTLEAVREWRYVPAERAWTGKVTVRFDLQSRDPKGAGLAPGEVLITETIEPPEDPNPFLEKLSLRFATGTGRSKFFIEPSPAENPFFDLYRYRTQDAVVRVGLQRGPAVGSGVGLTLATGVAVSRTTGILNSDARAAADSSWRDELAPKQKATGAGYTLSGGYNHRFVGGAAGLGVVEDLTHGRDTRVSPTASFWAGVPHVLYGWAATPVGTIDPTRDPLVIPPRAVGVGHATPRVRATAGWSPDGATVTAEVHSSATGFWYGMDIRRYDDDNWNAAITLTAPLRRPR